MAYANFLKQPLELWMFVPCDEEGNFLEEPKEMRIINGEGVLVFETKIIEEEEYQQAKERVLFDGFEIDNSFITHESHSSFFYPISCLHERTIKDLVKCNLQLTETAIKMLNL